MTEHNKEVMTNVEHSPEEELVSIVNSPIDMKEYEDRMANLRLEAKQAVLGKPKTRAEKREYKRRHRKLVQVPHSHKYPEINKLTGYTNGILKQLKVKNLYDRKVMLAKALAEVSDMDTTMSDVIKYYCLVEPSRDISAIEYVENKNFKNFLSKSYKGFVPAANWKESYDNMRLQSSMHSTCHPLFKIGMSEIQTIECLIDLWAAAFRYEPTPYLAYLTMHSWIMNCTPHWPTVKEKFWFLNPKGYLRFVTSLVYSGIGMHAYNTPLRLHATKRNSVVPRELRDVDFTKPPTRTIIDKVLRTRECANYTKNLCVHRKIVHSLGTQLAKHLPSQHARQLRNQLVSHDVDKLLPYQRAIRTYIFYIHPKLPQVTCGDCGNPFDTHTPDYDASSTLFKSLKDLKEKSMGGIKSVLTNLAPDSVKNICERLKGHFDDISEIVAALADKIKIILKPIQNFLGMGDIAFTTEGAIDIVKYYIIYINTESTVLKYSCIYFILQSMGIFGLVSRAFMSYFGETTTVFDPISENETTSLDSIMSKLSEIFSSLLSIDPKIVAIPLGFLIFLFFGVKIGRKHMTGLGSSFVDSMKNFHFIGAGALGIGRFIETLIKSIKFIFDWCGKKIFNKLSTEEKKEQEEKEYIDDFSKWVKEVEELSLEENGPRLAQHNIIQRRVIALYEKGVKYSRDDLDGKFSRELHGTLVRTWKLLRPLYNTILRAQSVHNFRATPFHIQMYGEPGIGKSTLVSSIASRFKDKFYPGMENYIFAHPQHEQFDGYAGQPIVTIDDAVAVNDYKLVLHFLAMISNCPYPLLMSHLENKGTHFTSEIIISTTNNPYPKVSGFFCLMALWRRRGILVNVTIDPQVVDQTTGAFSLELFKKHYPEQDPHAYPHLSFTLMNPVVPEQELGDVALPNGITLPTSKINFERFIMLVMQRAVAFRKSEESFVGNDDIKYKLLREHLSEIDNAYDELKSNKDVWKQAYEEFFFDNGRHTKPKSSPPKPASQNFEEISKETFMLPELFIKEFEECLKKGDDLKIDYIERIIRVLEDQIFVYENISPKVLAHTIGLIHIMRQLLIEIQDVSVAGYERCRDYISNVIFNISANIKVVMFNDDDEDVLIPLNKVDNWTKVLDLVDYENNSDAQKVITELTLHQIPIPTKLQKINETTAINPLIEISHHHMSSDPEELREELAELREDEITGTQIVINMINTSACEASILLLSLIDGDELDAPALLLKLDQLLQENEQYKRARDSDNLENPDYAIREELARLAVVQLIIHKIEVELDEQEKRNRFGRAKARTNIPSFEPAQDGEFFFGQDIDPVLGCRLTPGMLFGLKIRFASSEWRWFRMDDPTFPKMYPNMGYFYLNKEEWSQWTSATFQNGNTGLALHFLKFLKRHRNPQTNQIEWWVDPSELLDSYEVEVKFGSLTAAITKYVALASCPEFKKSVHHFMSLSPASRDCVYRIWLKHHVLINMLLSYARAVTTKAQAFATKIYNKLSGAVSYLWQICKKYSGAVSLGVVACAIIGACTAVSRLFVPQTTSFRASNIFASKSGRANFTSDGVISAKALNGIVRCHLEGARFQAYKIYNQCLLAPYHVMAKVMSDRRPYLLTVDMATGVKHQFHIEARDVMRFKDTDLTLIYSANFPAWGDRVKFIKNNNEHSMEKKETAYLAIRDENGGLEVGETVYSGKESGRTVTFSNSPVIKYAELGVLSCHVHQGVSGAPIFLIDSNRNDATIAGFQSYRSSGNRSFFTLITREAIEDMLASHAGKLLPDNGPFVVTYDIEPEAASLFQPHVEVVGYVPKEFQTTQPGKTEFSKTILYKHFPVTRVPAILSEKDPRACGDPALHSLNKHGRDNTCTINPIFLRQAINDYVAFFETFPRPRQFTIDEAILGVGTLKHIDLNTSPGIPWIYNRKLAGKKDYIQIDEFGNLTYLDPEFKKAILNTRSLFHDNLWPNHTMQEILKDELRPASKAWGMTLEEVEYYSSGVPYALWPKDRTCKTRTITVMEMVWTVLCRQLTGGFIQILHTLAETGTFPFSVGINVESVAAARAYSKAKQLNDYGFDLDVSNWDGHFGPQCAEAVTALINGVYKDGDNTTRRNLVNSAITGYVQYKDAVVKKTWGMPSGFPGTADYNTIWHMLMAYSFWLELASQNGHFELMNLPSYFAKTFELMYGDDRIVVPSREIESWYNANTVLALYQKYGWPTTSADKSENVEMRPLKDLQFLKRTWLVDPYDPFYVHWALEKETITNLLVYVRRTNEPRKQFIENLYNALDFAADWGLEYYEDLRSQINDVLKRHNYPIMTIPYTTIREIKRARYFDLPHEEMPCKHDEYDIQPFPCCDSD